MIEQHTPGPWAVNPVKAQIDEMHGLTPICGMLWPTDIRSEAETEANARRIVAAVNACEGIPTEALEAGALQKLLFVVTETVEWFQTDNLSRYPKESRVALDLERALAKLRGDTDAQ